MELVKEEKRKVIEAEIRLKVMLTTETQSKHTNFYGMMKVLVVLQLCLVLGQFSIPDPGVWSSNIGLFCLYQVDELMRQELADWKLAVDKDKGGKTKGNAKVLNWVVTVYIDFHELFPDSIFMPQKKKGSKSGKKKKKEKDLTAERWGLIEPIFEWICYSG